MEFICLKNKVCINKAKIRAFKIDGARIHIWDDSITTFNYYTEKKAEYVFEELKKKFEITQL